MATLEKNDFVQIEYTGKIKDTNQIFDTTSQETAMKAGIYNAKMTYGSVVICVGQNQVIPGIDYNLIGKEENTGFAIDISPELAFGKKNAKLVKLVPSNVFKKQKIQPFVGLEVQIDNAQGIIRSISGGRILVDFNNPLAGRDLNYEIKIHKKVTDPAVKVRSFISLIFRIKEPKVTVVDNKAEVEMALPAEITKTVAGKIIELVPELKAVEFVAKKNISKKEEKV